MMDEETRLRRRKQGIIIMTRGGMRAWTPARLGSSLLALWDAEDTDTLTLDTAAVTTWESSVGAFAPTQATGGNKPAYSATSFNGRPGVTFATDDSLTAASPVLPADAEPCEMWALVSQDALAADATTRTVFSYGASSAGRAVQRIVATGVNRAQVSVGTGGGNTTIPETAVDFSGICVARARFAAATAFISAGGGAEISGAAVPATVATRLRIGANSNTTAGAFFNGVINCLLVTSPLASHHAARLMQYLRDRTNG